MICTVSLGHAGVCHKPTIDEMILKDTLYEQTKFYKHLKVIIMYNFMETGV